MATVKIDLIDGRGKITRDGYEFERKAIVYGIDTAAVSAHRRIVEAYNVLVSDATRRCAMGDQHPSGVAAYLEEATPQVVDQDKVEFRLLYKPLDPQFSQADDDDGVIEIGSGLIQVDTNKDVDGNLMTVSYDHPEDGTLTQSGTVPKLVPQSTIQASRRETGSPGAKSRAFVGRVCGAWNLDPGAPARSWLCTGITGRSIDRGVTWDVSYTFQYKEEGWDEEVVYIDPETGRVPSDIVEGTGYKLFVIYGTANFTSLNL